MGVTYSLHLIDPAKFTRVAAELAARPFTSVRDVQACLDQRGTVAEDDRQSTVAGFSEFFAAQDEDLGSYVYNDLLIKVVTETEWYLDKSLSSHALAKPLTIFPALRPLRFLVDFSGWDILPQELRCDSGLYGLWPARFLLSARAVVEQFSRRADAEQYASAAGWSLTDRLFRRPRRSSDALKAWLDYWDSWEDIGEAIRATVERGWTLGFVMRP